MKKNLKKIGAAALATTLAFAAVPVATNAMLSLDLNEVFEMGVLEALPEFGSFRGSVVEITEDTVRVQRAESTVVFQKNEFTHILGDIVVGGEVTGFWSTRGIMTMQYPPHHNARLIASNEAGDVVLDRFYSDGYIFVGSDSNIALNFSDETPILLEDGQNVREILEEGQTLESFLEGRLIAVTHSLLNRMMPGGTIPSDPSLSVTVLFETPVHPIGDIGFDDFVMQTPEYTYIEGVVIAIYENWDGGLTFATRSENGTTTHFIKDHLTFVKGYEIAVGDTIQGFFDTSSPVPAVYPAQHVARVIVNKSDDTVVGNTTIINADKEFISTITEGIPVHFAGGNNVHEVLEEGQIFEEVLDNRTLVVTHDEEGNLLSVVVLYVRAVTLPGMGLDLGLDHGFGLGLVGDVVFGDNPISVEDTVIDAQWQEIDGEYYVPLRAIVEALDPNHTILWDNEARAVLLNNGVNDITVTIGSATVKVGEITIEMAAPAILIDGFTYVPFRFFNTAFGVNNAWMHAGQVFIDNQEIMQ